jgi:hypothetical protein
MNNIRIKGPHNGRVYRKDYILDYVETSLEILNLTPEWTSQEYDITVTVFEKFPKDYSYAHGLCYGSQEDIKIDVSREDVSFDFLLQTLAHELIHAKQYVEDRRPIEWEAENGELFLHDTVKQRLKTLQFHKVM